MRQIPQRLLTKVAAHFNGDIARVSMWAACPNPVLDGMRPKDYHQDNWKRLEKMIDDALMEYSANEQQPTGSY